jgi:hypothetical protein
MQGDKWTFLVMNGEIAGETTNFRSARLIASIIDGVVSMGVQSDLFRDFRSRGGENECQCASCQQDRKRRIL